MPELTPIVDRSYGLCGLHDPQLSHFDTHHNLKACTSQPLENRSFARKDKLNEHIQRIHLRHQLLPLVERQPLPTSTLLDDWRRDPTGPDALWCGFFQKLCPDWQERLKHVGEHLSNGANITAWSCI